MALVLIEVAVVSSSDLSGRAVSFAAVEAGGMPSSWVAGRWSGRWRDGFGMAVLEAGVLDVPAGLELWLRVEWAGQWRVGVTGA